MPSDNTELWEDRMGWVGWVLEDQRTIEWGWVERNLEDHRIIEWVRLERSLKITEPWNGVGLEGSSKITEPYNGLGWVRKVLKEHRTTALLGWKGPQKSPRRTLLTLSDKAHVKLFGLGSVSVVEEVFGCHILISLHTL